MQLLRTFRGIDKREFEVPETDLEAFRSEVPDAVEVMEFRGPDQRAFAVPESDLDAFRSEVPDAAPIKRARTRDGRVVDGPDLEQAAAEEFDSLSRDLNSERGKWRIMRGNQKRRRAELERNLDAHLRAFAPELGIPEQWARPDDPAAPLPEGIPRMPAGLDMRARQQWMEDREYERLTAPRAFLAPDGRTVLDAATGEPAVSAQGGVAQAAPNRKIRGVQWQDEAGVWRDGTGRALSPYDLDESDERARESALGFKLWMRGEEPGGLPVIPGVDPEEQRAQRGRLVDAGRVQRDADLADTLKEETARNLARLKYGRGIGAGEQFTRVVKNAGDYIPFSPVPLAKALVVDDIMKRDAAWAAWDEGGRQGPEPPRITPLEEARANQYLSDKHLQEELGRSMTAGTVEGVAHLVPYMAEMAMGGGLVGAVQKGVGKAIVSRAAGKRAAEAVGKWASKSLARRAAVWGGKTAGALAVDATVRTALNPMGFAADYVGRREVPGAVRKSSKPGQLFERVYFPEERQGRVEAFLNTLGDRWVEYFSEGVGDRLTLGLGKALSGTSRVGRYVRRLGTRPVVKYLKKAGFAGGPLEFLEERVGGGMREALGVDLTAEQKAAPLGERLSRGLIPGEEEGLIEAAVLMVPMLGAGALNTVMERRQLGRLREFRDAERAERGAMNGALAAAGIDAGEFAARTWRTAHGGRSVQATAADVEQIEAQAIGILRKYGEPGAVKPEDLGADDRRMMEGLMRARRTALDALDLHAARGAAAAEGGGTATDAAEGAPAAGGPWVTMDDAGNLVDAEPGTDGAVPVTEIIAEFEAPEDPGDGGESAMGRGVPVGIEGTEESLVLDDGRVFRGDETIPPGSYSIGGQTVTTAAPMSARALAAGMRPETPAARSARLLEVGAGTEAVDQIVASGSTEGVRAAAPGAGIAVGGGQGASGQLAVGGGQAADAGQAEQHRRNYRRLLAEMWRRRGGRGPSPDARALVTYASGAGLAPRGVYRDLARLGLGPDKAEKLVQARFPSFKRREVSIDERQTLQDIIINDLGGIRDEKRVPGTRAARIGPEGDYDVPLRLRNKGGATLDQIMVGLRDYGYDFETADQLVAAINDETGKQAALANPEAALRADQRREEREYAAWERDASEEVPIASLLPGAVYTIRGRAWTVAGESDTALEVRPIGPRGPAADAAEFIPFELDALRIDKGSLKPPGAGGRADAGAETPPDAEAAGGPAPEMPPGWPDTGSLGLSRDAGGRRPVPGRTDGAVFFVQHPGPVDADRSVRVVVERPAAEGRGRIMASGSAATGAAAFRAAAVDYDRQVAAADGGRETVATDRADGAERGTVATAATAVPQAGTDEAVPTPADRLTALQENKAVIPEGLNPLQRAAAEHEAAQAELREAVAEVAPGVEVGLAIPGIQGDIEVSPSGDRIRAQADFLPRLKKKYGNNWREALRLAVGEELIHQRHIRERGGKTQAEKAFAQAWREASAEERQRVHAAYGNTEGLSDAQLGAEMLRMREQADTLGHITESVHPDRGAAAADYVSWRTGKPQKLSEAGTDEAVPKAGTHAEAAPEAAAAPAAKKKALVPPKRPAKQPSPASRLPSQEAETSGQGAGSGQAAEDSRQDAAAPSAPSPASPAGSAAAAKMSPEQRARLEAIKRKLQGHIDDGTLREETEPYYAGRRLVPPARSVVREGGRISGEALQVGLDLAALYAETGLTRYEDFAGAVRRDLPPDMWETLKPHLPAFWNHAGADNPALEEINRQAAAEVHARIEALGRGGPGGVGVGDPVLSGAAPAAVPQSGSPAAEMDAALEDMHALRRRLEAAHGAEAWEERLAPSEQDGWDAAMKRARAAVQRLRRGGGARWWDTPAVQAARAAQAAEEQTDGIDTPERMALRADIAREMYGNGSTTKGRQLWIVMGLPGAGKSRVVVNEIKRRHGAFEVDADVAKTRLPEFAGGAGAGRVHKESAVIAERFVMEQRCLPAGDNVVFPTVGRNAAKLAALVARWQAGGYTVHLINVEVAPDTSIERALTRWGESGRFVDPAYIAGLGLQPAQTFATVKSKADSYEHWNNEVPWGTPPVLVERGTGVPAGRDGQGAGRGPDAGGRGTGGGGGTAAGQAPDVRGGVAGGAAGLPVGGRDALQNRDSQDAAAAPAGGDGAAGAAGPTDGDGRADGGVPAGIRGRPDAAGLAGDAGDAGGGTLPGAAQRPAPGAAGQPGLPGLDGGVGAGGAQAGPRGGVRGVPVAGDGGGRGAGALHPGVPAGVRGRPQGGAGEGAGVRAGDGPAGVHVAGENWRLTRADLAAGGAAARAEANMAALRLLKRIESEGRAATPDEQRILAAYAGWGHTGMKNAIFPVGAPGKGTLGALAAELKQLLTPEEHRTASRSTQYAHYTTPEVIAPMWRAALRLGFRGGRVFEPGYGAGRFLGMIPEEVAGATVMSGIEMDGVSAAIARLLYPRSDLRHGDFVDFPLVSDTFDLVIGNPPFSDRVVTADPNFAKQKLLLHDYFIAKSLAMLKPGGIGILVTSHGTMDKGGQKARALIAREADLLGAIRLPNTAFKTDAGTEVVTDILFIRKRELLAQPGGEAWLELAEIRTADGGKAWVNEYFARHPEMVLGRHALSGKMRFGGGREYTVEPAAGDLEAQVAAAVARLPEIQPAAPAPSAAAAPLPAAAPSGADAKAAALAETRVDGGFLADGARVFMAEGAVRVPVLPIAERKHAADGDSAYYVSKDALGVIRSYIPLRNAYIAVMREQRRTGNDAQLAAAQRELKKQYDRFLFLHGRLGRSVARTITDEATGEETEARRFPNIDAIKMDVWYGGVAGLERYDADGSFENLAPIFTERVIGVEPAARVETPADALAAALRETGRADVARAAALLGRGVDETAESLGDLVYRDPADGQWLTAQQYLTGNVKEKLKAARSRAAADASYRRNVEALEKVQPADLPPSRISLELGMPVIPPADIRRFMAEVVGVPIDAVAHQPLTGRWTVTPGDGVPRAQRVVPRFATRRRTADEILESVLANQPVEVYDTDKDGKRVYNADESAAANEAARQMRDAWGGWVWADASRMDRLARAFNEAYNVWHDEPFDGSHLTFPGLSTEIKPYPHQRDVAWRFLSSGNTYAVHEVGLGKTFAAILGVMESRRIGAARKPMIVVPNHMLGQWNSDFLATYPAARILLADEDHFAPRLRQRFLGHVAAGNYDAVIITHSAFKLLGVAPETEREFIDGELAEYRRVLLEMDSKDRGRKDIEKAIERLEDKLKRLSHLKRDKGLVWDDLGVDMLVVDEAHEYRKLAFQTTRTRTKGIDPDGSDKAWDLNLKLQLLHRRTPGRNVMFLSGTPIVNTMAEAYSVLRMLAPDALKQAGVATFDAWAATFAGDVQSFEKTAGVGYQIVSRLGRWQNLQMLSGIWRQVADYKRYDDLPYMRARASGRRPVMRTGGIQGVVVPESPAQKDYRERVVTERIEAIKQRSGPPHKGDDILLNVITDAIHVALDERFADSSLPPDPDGKLARMSAKIVEIWEEGNRGPVPDRRAQIVFMDKGLPDMECRRGFSTYLALRRALIDAGIPAREIAFAQDFKKKADKERLQADVRSGRVRVLIGSMQGMGTGMNVQERLAAAHFMTIPWYPALVEQAAGRIIRQGNMFARSEVPADAAAWAEQSFYPGLLDQAYEAAIGEVDVFAYMTAGTIEEFMWGMNETKSRWIEGFYRGGTDSMDGELDSQSDQYALLKQMTSDDPRVRQLAEMQSELARLQSLERAHLDGMAMAARNLKRAEDTERDAAESAARLEALPPAPSTRGDAFRVQIGAVSYDKRKDAAGALGAAVMGVIGSRGDDVKVASFGGGYDVFVTDWSSWEDKTARVRLANGTTGLVSAIKIGGDDGHTPGGVLQQLENALSSIGAQIALYKSRVKDAHEDAARLRGLIKPWDRSDEMNQMRADIQRLKAEMAQSSQAAAHHGAAPGPAAGGVREGAARYGGVAAGAEAGYTGGRGEATPIQDAGAARADQVDGLGALPARRPAGGQGAGGAPADGALPGEAGARHLRAEAAPRSSLAAWRLPDGRGVAPRGPGVPAELRRRAEAAVRANYDAGSPAADAAVRETIEQMELAFAAPADPYPDPAPAPRRVIPDALRLRRARRARETALREQERAWEARKEKIRRALATWSPDALADLLGDQPDAGISFVGPHGSRERMHRVKGGGDALWDEGAVLVLDEGAGVVIRSPLDVARLMLPLRSPEFESFRVVALDKDNRVLGARVMSTGLVDSCPVAARVALGWIPPGTAGLVVAHNHPSGDPTPSGSDIKISQNLAMLGDIIGIPVLDHVITNGAFTSQRGMNAAPFGGADPYGGAGAAQGRITDRLADWEVVPHTMRPQFGNPEDVVPYAKPLREAALAQGGQIAHVLMVDSRNRLVAVERIDAAALSPEQFAGRVAGTVLRHGEIVGVFLDFSFADQRVARLSRAAASAVGAANLRMLDAFDHAYNSQVRMKQAHKGGWGGESAVAAAAAESGAVAEDPAPYDAVQAYAATPPERLTDAQLSDYAAIEYRRPASARAFGRSASLVSTFQPGLRRVELTPEQARAVARAGELFDALARRSRRFADDLIPHFDTDPPGRPRPGEALRHTFRPSTEPMYNVRFLEFLDRVDPVLAETLAARAFEDPLPQRPGSLAMARASLDPDDVASTLAGRAAVYAGADRAGVSHTRSDVRDTGLREEAAPYGGRRLVPPPRSEVREFAGTLARTAPDASRAEAMEKDGADREAVWRETGFWRGPDGEWRFELDTRRRMLKPGALARAEKEPQPLASVIDHPALFAAYPRVSRITVERRVATGGPEASFDEKHGHISLTGPRETDWDRVLAHEVQHAIQGWEVWDKGGDMTADSIIEPLVEERRRLNRELAEMAKSGRYDSPEYRAKNARRDAIIDQEWEIENPDNARGAYDAYRRLAGEAEARLAERRLGMTPAERAAEPPWETLEKMLRDEGLLKDGQRPEDVLIRPRASVAEEAAEYGAARPAVTPEQDAAYLAAVEAGDMDTAQKMVDEAAKAAGYNVGPVFHATDADFTVFDRARLGENTAANATDDAAVRMARLGFWFHEKPLSKEIMSKKDVRTFLRLNNPRRTTFDQLWAGKKSARGDGLIVADSEFGGTSYVVFSPSQIKLADAVTRDESGRVIPLSERFDPERDDILHEDPAPYGVRESGVPYGSGSVPPAADGAPDWDAFADLAQRVADLERHAPRRIEITRAIERDRMTRLAREMQRLKRSDAKAKAEKTAGKAAGLDAARRTYETIAGRQADEQATVGDLMREALAIGRRRGRESRTALDLTRMLREALNARVKRLMGSQLPLPTDWRARNAAVNRRMLGELGQIETSIQAAAPDQRAAAAAAELRRLFGLDKAQWTALESETRMDALGPATLLQAARKAIERDLRAYYRAEFTTLFGGRPVERRLPSGQTITVASEGLARRGLRRMVPEQRRAMEDLLAGIDFANIKDMPLDAMRQTAERAREILADDALAKEAIAEGHQIRRENAAEAAAAEIVAARPELDQAETADPRKGGLLQRLGWFTASQRRRALLLSGGDDSGAVGTVLWRNLLAASERQLTLETADLRALDDKLAGLGFTRESLLALSYQPREVELADGRTVLMTRGEMMTLYGMTLDEDARAKLVRNGWRPARWRHDAGRTIRGEGEDYDARLAASEAIIGGVVAQLAPEEKSLVEWMVVDQSREWARRGNETSRRMTGAELFEDRPHITLAGSIDRQAELPNVEDPAFSFRAHMVDRMGLTRERQAHTHPLLVRDMLSVYRQQARDMSVFTAWSLPFRDAISMLSRGPALGAIVSRWGVEAVKTMKETLAHATYQKGHTDNWNALQRWFFARERAAAGFILGLRASSAVLNRYGGAITMAAGLAAEGRGRSGAAARFLARVFRPQAGLARLGVRERKAAYDAMMADGYLYDRWHRSPYRVFAQMASQRMEIEESERASQNARSLARQDAWRRFQQWALSGMTKGEIGNGVDMYLTLRSGGMSQADAVREVSRLTRLTQNPSTPLEETTQYSAIRSAGLGFALPFQGQPTVMWDWVKAEHIRARRSGDWRPFRAALSGALSATLFSVAMRLLMRRAAKGLMDGDGDDDKALQAETANTILDLAGELSGAAMPGTDPLAQAFLRPILSVAMDNRSLMAVPPGDSTLLGQIGESAQRLGSAGLRLARGDDWSEEQVEKLLMDMHRLVGMTTGLPTGGLEQAARVGFGLYGDPLGREPPAAPAPVSRRRRLLPPARRRQ